MRIKNYFTQSIEIIKKRSRKIFIALAIIYFISFSLGFSVGFNFKYLDEAQQEEIKKAVGQVNEFLTPFDKLIEEKQFAYLSASIFFNNIRSSIVFALLGFIIIPTFIFLYSLGSILGLFFGLVFGSIYNNFTLLEMLGLTVTFLLESFAILLSAREGIYLGTSLLFPKKIFNKKISRRKALKITAGQTAKVFIIIAILLLFAAVVEVLTIYSLSSKQIQIINFA